MTAYEMFHVFMCGGDERIANVYQCCLCLASSCDLPIMLCTTDGQYTVAVLSQSIIGFRAAMSLALPARRCYQSCKSTDTLPKD